MVLHIFKTLDELNESACQLFVDVINVNNNVVLGLATGSSPLGLYDRLATAVKDGRVSFKNVRTFNLDEYEGLSPEHPQSYNYFMQENLFSKIDIDRANTLLPRGNAADMQAECEAYEAAIEAAGGIQLQLLGMGTNGHIGFNEPGTPFGSRTQIVDLAEATIDANSRFFSDRSEVPRRAISMGVRSIMNARSIVMVTMGKSKAEAVKAFIEGPVTEDCPASVLQLHPCVHIFMDEEAASLLSK